MWGPLDHGPVPGDLHRIVALIGDGSNIANSQRSLDNLMSGLVRLIRDSLCVDIDRLGYRVR